MRETEWRENYRATDFLNPTFSQGGPIQLMVSLQSTDSNMSKAGAIETSPMRELGLNVYRDRAVGMVQPLLHDFDARTFDAKQQ